MMPDEYNKELDNAILYLEEYGKKKRYYFFGTSFGASICWGKGQNKTVFTIDGKDEIDLRNEIKKYDKAGFWLRWYYNIFYNMEKKRAQLYYAQALRLLHQIKMDTTSCLFNGKQFLTLSDHVEKKLNNSFSSLHQFFQENSLMILNMMRYFNKSQAIENKYSENDRASFKSFQKKHFLCYQLEAEKLYQALREEIASQDKRLTDTYNVFIWKMKLAATCADASRVEEIFVQQNKWIQALSLVAEKQHLQFKNLAYYVRRFKRNADRKDKFKKFRLTHVKDLISHLDKIANYSPSSQLLLGSKEKLADAEKAFKVWKSEYDDLASSYKNFTNRLADLKEIFEVKLQPVQRFLQTINTGFDEDTSVLLARLKESKETPQQMQKTETHWVCIVRNYLFWSNSYFFYIESHAFLDADSTNLSKGWQDFVDKAKEWLAFFEKKGIPANSKRLIVEDIDSTINRLEADIKQENPKLRERSCVRLEAYRQLQKFLKTSDDKLSTPPEKKHDCQLENPSIILEVSSLEPFVKVLGEATMLPVSSEAGQGSQTKGQPTPAFDTFSSLKSSVTAQVEATVLPVSSEAGQGSQTKGQPTPAFDTFSRLKPSVTAQVEATVLPISPEERPYSQVDGPPVILPEIPSLEPSELESPLIKMQEKKVGKVEAENDDYFLLCLKEARNCMIWLVLDLKQIQMKKNHHWEIADPEAEAIYNRFNENVRKMLLKVHPDKVSQSSAAQAQANEIFAVFNEVASKIKHILKNRACYFGKLIEEITDNLTLLQQKIKKYQKEQGAEVDELSISTYLIEIIKEQQREMREDLEIIDQYLKKQDEVTTRVAQTCDIVEKGLEVINQELERMDNEIEEKRQAREKERHEREAEKEKSRETMRKLAEEMAEIEKMMQMMIQEMKSEKEEAVSLADFSPHMLETNSTDSVPFYKDLTQVNNSKLFADSSEQAPTLDKDPGQQVLKSEPPSPGVSTNRCHLFAISQVVALQDTSRVPLSLSATS